MVLVCAMAIIKYCFLLLLLFTLAAEAVVFRCELPNGAMLYQQLPCNKLYARQSILPIINSKLSSADDLGEQRKFNVFCKNNYIDPIQKAIAREYNKQLKLQQRHKRAEAARIAKTNRRKQRCQEINVKIQLLQNRLRLGYTARQEVKLKEQLLHYTNLQQKYCD